LTVLLSACGGGGNGGGGGGSQAPQAGKVCVSTPVNTVKNGTLPASDPDGQALSFDILDQPNKGSLVADANGNYTYTPATGVRGMDHFTFRARDTSGLEAIGTLTVLIDGAMRVMPLGDSITEGTSIGSSESPPLAARVSYRRKLYSDLESLSGNYRVNFVGSLSNGSAASPPIGDPHHEGHGGYCDGIGAGGTCDGRNVADLVIGWLNANPADIVLLHVGTNNFEPNNPGDVDQLLDNIESWAAAHYPVSVFLARTIPTINGNLDINTYNNGVDGVAQDRPNVRVIRVNQQTGAGIHTGPNTANSAFMGDNLHPNQAGYDRMAAKWLADLSASGVLPDCN
jgi:lysophospholipase L1-like esterase